MGWIFNVTIRLIVGYGAIFTVRVASFILQILSNTDIGKKVELNIKGNFIIT